jgi:hypothetical protein
MRSGCVCKIDDGAVWGYENGDTHSRVGAVIIAFSVKGGFDRDLWSTPAPGVAWTGRLAV